jgi:UPF0042 nucleotide-binding protein
VTAPRVHILFVTGLSGSGKSMASRVLEDLGYYALDNLPCSLIPKFVELLATSGEEIPKAALVVDVRDRSFSAEFPRVLEEVRALGHRAEVLFLEASDDVLVRRFSETRRQHPLGLGRTVSQAIHRERDVLSAIRALADRIVDTSSLTVHTLGRRVVEWEREQTEAPPRPLDLTLLTFGFKYGVPRDTDWIFDVRFLPNPFFVPGLRELSGREPAVRDHVMSSPAAAPFVRGVCDILRGVLPFYTREGRTHLTVAVGCTGGRHRSVAISGEIERSLLSPEIHIVAIDRDIDKG